ncbi:hypothetical protein, partial [Piscirickettsia salmonis]
VSIRFHYTLFIMSVRKVSYTTGFTIEEVEFEREDSYDDKRILNMTNFSQNQVDLTGQLNRYSVLNTPFLNTHHHNNEEESECCCIIQ